MSTIDISAGTIHYEATGPADGRPVVFVHGYMMGGQLWRQVSERLAARGLRCIAPTWPLGAHPEPLRRGADQTITGVAGMVAEVLAALDLRDVVLVGNDTGGVVTQLVAVHHRERLGALVLTSCDAFEHFPPPILRPLLLAAKSKTLFRTAIQAVRAPAVRARAFNGLAHSNIDDLTEVWVRPALSLPAVDRRPAAVHSFDAHRGDDDGGGPAIRLRQADAHRVVRRRRVLRAGRRGAAGRNHSQRPPRSDRGGQDLFHGRSA